jgi:hypothetical protein
MKFGMANVGLGGASLGASKGVGDGVVDMVWDGVNGEYQMTVSGVGRRGTQIFILKPRPIP